MRPIAIPANIQQHNQPKGVLLSKVAGIRARIEQLRTTSPPDVSIVIPAYNEAETILRTLSSLAATTTRRSVEFIVVNNNSKDETEELIRLSGAICVNELEQGIAPARNAGLRKATGPYVLNADADTIYPPDWIDIMLEPMLNEQVALVYGPSSFIPTTNVSRLVFFIYEYVSDITKWYNKHFHEEAVNIYGFTSGMRRVEGLQVDGFTFPKGAGEDGWLGVKLREEFQKHFHQVSSPKAIVWTTDRRIQIDGGLLKGILKRARRYAGIVRQ